MHHFLLLPLLPCPACPCPALSSLLRNRTQAADSWEDLAKSEDPEPQVALPPPGQGEPARQAAAAARANGAEEAGRVAEDEVRVCLLCCRGVGLRCAHVHHTAHHTHVIVWLKKQLVLTAAAPAAPAPRQT